MPFPWKKTKIARISRIVADIPSPRHGGSLVVETGFPTSLIDLFFKNRDRLKKPSPRRRSKGNRAEPQICDPTSPSSTSLLGFRSSMSRTDSIDASPQSSIHRIEDAETFEEVKTVGDRGGDRNQGEECGGGVGGELNGLFAAMLKLFMVVVLALSTKKLAVGITLSAFLLLILEFLGKHAIRVVEPCLSAKSALQSLTRRVSEYFSDWKNNSVQRNLEISNQNFESKDLITGADETEEEFIEEIQIVEPNFDAEERVERIDMGRAEFDFLSRESRWGRLHGEKKKWNLEDCEDGGEASTIKNKSWKKAKLKAKIIKKLVPKKIRKAKKLKKMEEKEKDFNQSRETSGFFEDDKWISEQQSGEVDEKPDEEEDDDEEEVEEKGNEGCEEQLRVINGVKGSEREGSKGYIILVLIVLAGLIGGRIPALLLTVAGSFMFKMITAERKFPLVNLNCKFCSPGTLKPVI